MIQGCLLVEPFPFLFLISSFLFCGISSLSNVNKRKRRNTSNHWAIENRSRVYLIVHTRHISAASMTTSLTKDLFGGFCDKSYRFREGKRYFRYCSLTCRKIVVLKAFDRSRVRWVIPRSVLELGKAFDEDLSSNTQILAWKTDCSSRKVCFMVVRKHNADGYLQLPTAPYAMTKRLIVP